MPRGRSFVLVVFLAACGAPAGSGSAPPSNAALERACAEQRRTHALDRGCLAVAMASARTGDCKLGGARVHVKATFAPDGSVPEAVVDLVQPPEAAPAVEACLVERFRALRIPAFSGASVTVGKTIER